MLGDGLGSGYVNERRGEHRKLFDNEGDVCPDCMEGNHEICRHEGGYTDDEDNSQRCGCHLTGHALDNRKAV